MSIKIYDKAGSILRVETTIARTSDFKVLRPLDSKPDGKLSWKPLRKGVADLHRRAQVSQRSNERYLDALAVVDDATPCSRLFDAVSRPIVDDGRRFRALRLGDPDAVALLKAISRGEFATAGFRNRDLRGLLCSSPKATDDDRRRSGKVSRQLRLLWTVALFGASPGGTGHRTHRGRLRYSEVSKHALDPRRVRGSAGAPRLAAQSGAHSSTVGKQTLAVTPDP